MKHGKLKKKEMKEKSSRPNRSSQNGLGMLMLSILFLMVPLMIWGLWILVFRDLSEASQQEKVAKYLSFFPEIFRGQVEISLLVLTFSILVIFFAILGIRKSSSVPSKLLGFILSFIGLFFILLQVFTMI